MRDHRSASRAILARYARTPRRLRAADRIVAALAGSPRPGAAVHTHTHTRAQLAITLALHRHLDPAPPAGAVTGGRMSERRSQAATIVAPRSPTPPRRQRQAVSASPPKPISPTVAKHLRDLTLTTTRTEARVRVVEKVLPRSAASADPSGVAARPAVPLDPLPTRHVRAATPSAAPSPEELNTITNHVLTAIDRRLIAHNERLGRG
jgi:hypothetical protein